MKTARFSDAQIMGILRQVEIGVRCLSKVLSADFMRRLCFAGR